MQKTRQITVTITTAINSSVQIWKEEQAASSKVYRLQAGI